MYLQRYSKFDTDPNIKEFGSEDHLLFPICSQQTSMTASVIAVEDFCKLFTISNLPNFLNPCLQLPYAGCGVVVGGRVIPFTGL